MADSKVYLGEIGEIEKKAGTATYYAIKKLADAVNQLGLVTDRTTVAVTNRTISDGGDHGRLVGLEDNDHLQYLMEAVSGLFTNEQQVGINYQAAHWYAPSGNFTSIGISGTANQSQSMFIWQPSGLYKTHVDGSGAIGINDPTPTAQLSIRQRATPPPSDEDILALEPYAFWDGNDVDGDLTYNAAHTPNNTVATWVDKTGNGHDLVEVSAGSGYVLLSGWLNGKDALGPNASHTSPGYKSWAGSAFGHPAGWTVIAVIRSNVAGPPGTNILCSRLREAGIVDYPGGVVGIPEPFSARPQIWTPGLPESPGTTYVEAFTLPDQTGLASWSESSRLFSKLAARYNGGTSWEMWCNGTALARDAGNCIAGATSPQRSNWCFIDAYTSNFGASESDVAYNYYFSTWLKIILFDRTLSSDEMALVDEYLEAQYGTPESGQAELPLQDWKDEDGNVDSIVDPDFNWGLGTDDPQEKLHVSGNIYATGLIYAPVVSGSTAVYGTLVQGANVIGSTSVSGAIVRAGTLTVRGTDSDTRYALSGATYASTLTSGKLPIADGPAHLTNSRVSQSGVSVVVSGQLRLVDPYSSFTGLLDTSILTIDRTITLPDTDGTLAVLGGATGNTNLAGFGPGNYDIGYVDVYYDNDNGQLQVGRGAGTTETSLLLFGDGAGGNFKASINPAHLVTFLSNGSGGRFLFLGSTSSPVITVSGGILSTATISGLEGTFGTLSVRGMDTDVRYALSGTGGGGTTYTAGSGIDLVGLTDFNVYGGYGLLTGLSGLSVDTSVLDIRYALSGATGGTSTTTIASGLGEYHRQYIPSGETINVIPRSQILVYGSYEEDPFSTLTVQPSGSLVVLTYPESSGLAYTKSESDARYLLSGLFGAMTSGQYVKWNGTQFVGSNS